MRMMRTLLTIAVFAVLPACAQPEKVSTQHLKEFENDLGELSARIIPATVAVKIGNAGGSGVIISEDGWVLTAAHVFSRPGQKGSITLHDGNVVHGETYGRQQTDDFGILKITTEGKWPHAEMGSSEPLERGDLCVATGHPGGFQDGRSPPLRFGRVTRTRGQFVQTSCTVDHGDSGGPLFDLKGRVIGIHSRIGGSARQNYHIPVDHYRKHWKRLVAKEHWGQFRFPKQGAVLGVSGDGGPGGSRLSRVAKGLPAAKAGLKVRDTIVKFGDDKVETWDDLSKAIKKHDVGDKVVVMFKRGGETQTATVKLALSPNAPRPEEAGEMPVVAKPEGKMSELLEDGDNLKSAFNDLAKKARHSVVRIVTGDNARVLGTVVGKDGWIVTKASELKSGDTTVTLTDGRKLKAERVTVEKIWDLAFLKVEASDLTPVSFVDAKDFRNGQWLASIGQDEEPLNVGVVSVRPRSLIAPNASKQGYLGITFDLTFDGTRIKTVMPETAAARAKLEVGDVIVAIEGKKIRSITHAQRILKLKTPGSKIPFKVLRGDKEMTVEATLGSRAEIATPPAPRGRSRGRGGRRGRGRRTSRTRYSQKSSGFKNVVQHDTILTPRDCGGPVFDSRGRCVGLNIARANRYNTLAIPAPDLAKLVAAVRKASAEQTPAAAGKEKGKEAH